MPFDFFHAEIRVIDTDEVQTIRPRKYERRKPMKKDGNNQGRTTSRRAEDERNGADFGYTCHYGSPLGGITMTGDGTALTGLWFDGQRHFPDELATVRREKPLPVFDAARRWLEVYFSGRDPGFTPPLNLSINATPFRKAVWEILLTIPFGRTMTYGEIARILAARNGLKKMSAQAVGGAVGHNPVSLIVPCHRVIGAGGSLTGYGGGLERKQCLLNLEMSGGR